MVKPTTLAGLLFLLPFTVIAAGTTVRQPVSDITVTLSRVPGKIVQTVKLEPNGTFRLANAQPGTWTLTATAPADYLEKWIAAELKRRNWKRGPAPAKAAADGKAVAADAAPVRSEGGSRSFTVLATDGKGTTRHLSFEMTVTVENVVGDRSSDGNYVKPMRWNNLEQGLSFKFRKGPGGNVLAGRVERVVVVE